MKPVVSLVMCTRNRAARIGECLGHIRRMQTPVPWEFVVVDNGSTDGTGSVVRDFAASMSVPVTVVNEPRPGLGRARNTGWRSASGEIIAFTDDDCYVAPDFIDAVAAVFEGRSRLGYAGGRILLHDPTDFPATINESLETVDFATGTILEPGMVQGANMMFRRSALEAIGGFDDDLGAGRKFVPEDIDAVTRASCAGWEGVSDPRPVVRHHHGRKAADIPHLFKTYARGRGAYWTKLMLIPATREQSARLWYWRIRRGYRNPRERPEVIQEIIGAVTYLLLYGPKVFVRARAGRV